MTFNERLAALGQQHKAAYRRINRAVRRAKAARAAGRDRWAAAWEQAVQHHLARADAAWDASRQLHREHARTP